MIHSEDKLRSLLVEPGYIDKAAFDEAVGAAGKEGVPLGTVLVSKGFIKDKELGQLIANDLKVPFVDLESTHIDVPLLRMLPELMAKESGVVPFSKTEEGVKVGFLDPNDMVTQRLLEKRFAAPIIPYLITERSLNKALKHFEDSLNAVFSKMLDKLKDSSLSQEQHDKVTMDIVNLLLQYGHNNEASDIHIEPYEDKVVVRFRIDGVMHDVLDIPKDLSDVIVTRIKVLAKLRTDEHRSAQDGKFSFCSFCGESILTQVGESVEHKELIDIRVSVVPVTKGENVVLRLLSSQGRQFALTDLGLSQEDFEKVERGIENPTGMILVTGPTGSGKTTTLYGILKLLNKREVHISTIEDPVEYDIEGVSQIQVDKKTNLTFAEGLRSIVRQDPDIIMVGEVRDKETADIAINSAMTGHLVLSTFHANDAATTLPRLLDMEVEPYLIASTVRLIVAQRLVRRVCKSCVASDTLDEKTKDALKRNPELMKLLQKEKQVNKKGKKTTVDIDDMVFFKGVGCEVCGHTGYRGRVGIFEVLEVTDDFKDAIMEKANSDEIMKIAKSEGMTTMLEDGVKKALSGVTTLEEVLRVTIS